MQDVKDEHKHGKFRTMLWMGLTVLIGVAALWLYFRYEHDASSFIRRMGPFGIITAIVLMALLCVIPFPAEFLMVVDMQIFGVWKGILYVWVGAMLGSYVTFLFGKKFGQRTVKRFVSDEHLKKLNEVITRHGAWGLFMSRLIPFIPFVVLNYACSLLPNVTTFTYLWTTGLGIMPYDLGAALIFLGFSRRLMVWLIAGGIAIVVIWLATLWLRRKHAKAVQPAVALSSAIMTDRATSRVRRTRSSRKSPI